MLHGEPPRNIPCFSSGAAKSVADNEDLLLKILLSLPIRSLVRFKSVSKRWLSIISDPIFCRQRSTSHPPTPSGIFLCHPIVSFPIFDFVDFRPNPPRLPFKSLKFSVPNHGIAILQSCNGLLLCWTRTDYFVYNPTTKEYRTLPKLPTDEEDIDRNSRIAGLSLAFDPLLSSTYEVVCIFRVLDSNNYKILIYSSDSGLWKVGNGQFSLPLHTMVGYGVYWNEAIHWTSNWVTCVYLVLREERVDELPMPGAYDDGLEVRRVEYFGNCGEHLHYMETTSEGQAVLIVYKLWEDRGGWSKKYQVDLHTALSALIGSPEMSPETKASLDLSKFTVLAIVDKNEVDEDTYVVLRSDGKAIRLNVNSGSYESLLYIHNDEGSTNAPVGIFFIDSFLYFESLACV